MTAATSTRRALSELSTDERETVWAKLSAVPRIAESEGYERWEIREQVSAEARSLGVRLHTAQVRAILRE